MPTPTTDTTTPHRRPARASKSQNRALLLGLFALVGLLFSAAFFVTRADNLKTKDWQREELTYLPSGKYLKPMVLGFTEAAASLLWVKGVLYFGEAYLTNRDYRWMGHILDIVTTLNPRFTEAYSFAASLLTKDKSEIEKTLKMIDRGLVEYPEQWRWRVSAALARQRLDSNLIAAAKYLQPLAQDTTVPPYVKGLTARFLEKGGGESMAIAFLVNQYFIATSPMQREIFAHRLAKIGLPPDFNDSLPSSSKFLTKRYQHINAMLTQAVANPKLELAATEILHKALIETDSLKETQP
jgi:hypothetical protein